MEKGLRAIMIYQISGSFKRRRWEVKCLDMFIPTGSKLGEVEKALPPFDYMVFLDTDKCLKLGDNVIVALLSIGQRIINNHILSQPDSLWYKDLGQL